MAEVIGDRVKRYILDGTDQDLRRLLSISQDTAEMARSAFRRVGVQAGWNAIDCGCGPIGGLAVMAEMVGPGGRIVGVDFSPTAVHQARAVASSLGLGNVEVVEGDIHELDSAMLGGPFDLAFRGCSSCTRPTRYRPCVRSRICFALAVCWLRMSR
jgi:SAM-dependent methyltransferase